MSQVKLNEQISRHAFIFWASAQEDSFPTNLGWRLEPNKRINCARESACHVFIHGPLAWCHPASSARVASKESIPRERSLENKKALVIRFYL